MKFVSIGQNGVGTSKTCAEAILPKGHNNRTAGYYKLTRAGRKRLAKETQKWETKTAILARFFAPPQES